MKISVIITSYNQKTYLRQTLNSVIAQTLLPYEIIICDDCSTDGSQRMIKDYERRYPNLIKAIYQDFNIGVTRNRNMGIKMATGDYVSTLDGDDLYYPKKLEKEMAAVKRTGALLVYSNVVYIDKTGQETGVRYKRHQLLEGCLFEKTATLKYPSPREVMIKRTCIEEMGFQDESFQINEDFEWMVRLASRFAFVAVDEKLVFHRIHSKGLSSCSNRLLLLETQKKMIGKALKIAGQSIEKDKPRTRKKLVSFLNLTRARIAEEQNQFSAARPYLFNAIRDDVLRSANYDLLLRLFLPNFFRRNSRLPDPLMIGPAAIPFYIARGI